LTDFNNFWHATLKETLRKCLQFWPPRPKVVATLPCEMQKSYFDH